AVVVPEGSTPTGGPLSHGALARIAERVRQPDTSVPPHVASAVRAAAGVPVAAVLRRDWLPVDIRHAAKVDRTELARWATGILHGPQVAREAFRSHPRAPSRRSL